MTAVGKQQARLFVDEGPADAFEHARLAESIQRAIQNHDDSGLVLGIEGRWGAGKTTILDELARRLRPDTVVVRFDTWSFREPERLVDRYVTSLEKALVDAGAAGRIGTPLRKLASGIAPIAGGRATAFFTSVLSLLPERDHAFDASRWVTASLGKLKKQVVILVDDLDRLERDELHAVLRTLRLFRDLPKTAHVLAYDRSQVSLLLFPDDASGRSARDYLAKLIDVEVAIPTPRLESGYGFLVESLSPMLNEVDPEEAQRFEERLGEISKRTLMSVLPTPRALHRAAKATALRWPLVRRDANLFDLFLLTVIHNRFPLCYATIHSHPEWFTEIEWSLSIEKIGNEEQWRNESKAYLKSLRDEEDVETKASLKLILALFPNLQDPSRGPTEEDARRDRRIFHPFVFPRYFQLSVGINEVSEASLEDMADQIGRLSADMVESYVSAWLKREHANQRLTPTLHQWDILLQRLRLKESRPLLVESIARGLVRVSVVTLGAPSGPFSERREIVSAIFQTLKALDVGNSEMTRVVSVLIRDCPSISIAGDLVFYTAQVGSSRRPLNVTLDDRSIQREFDHKIRQMVHNETGILAVLPIDDQESVLFRTEDSGIIREAVTQALATKRSSLPLILRHYLRLDGPLDAPKAIHDRLDELHRKADLENMDRMTESLKPEFWDDLYERALVTYFREHIGAAIARDQSSGSA